MFVDLVEIYIASGRGGDGAVSFHSEKYHPRAGPDGGDGGNGGNIYIQCVDNLDTLSYFRQHKKFVAEDGGKGDKNDMHGKNGKDIIINIPPGTIIWKLNLDEEGNDISEPDLLYDIRKIGEKHLLLKGGRGGYGNSHFANSVNQVPRMAEYGDINQEMNLMLELQLIADIAIIGMPNAGKSTLISTVSAAKPKIANYQFTTLSPNLGVVDYYDKSSVWCDIPGLIEGASDGKGLGHEFLRHIMRCSVILHLVPIDNEDIVQTYHTIRQELKKYDESLYKKPEIVVLTKTDISGDEIAELLAKEFEQTTKIKPLLVSSVTNQNIDDLKKKVFKMVQKYKIDIEESIEEEEDEIITYDIPQKVFEAEEYDIRMWELDMSAKLPTIRGKRIEQVARMTPIETQEGEMRIRDIFKKIGIEKALMKKGVLPGDKILIGKVEFEF